jgi:hypothetical protein
MIEALKVLCGFSLMKSTPVKKRVKLTKISIQQKRALLTLHKRTHFCLSQGETRSFKYFRFGKTINYLRYFPKGTKKNPYNNRALNDFRKFPFHCLETDHHSGGRTLKPFQFLSVVVYSIISFSVKHDVRRWKKRVSMFFILSIPFRRKQIHFPNLKSVQYLRCMRKL